MDVDEERVRRDDLAERAVLLALLQRPLGPAAGHDRHRRGAGDEARRGQRRGLDGRDGHGRALFQQIEAGISEAARAQLRCEIILLTHNADLHAVNLGWHPKAESLLWRPDIQETKVSEGGGVNVRYRAGWKGRWLARFKALLAETLPDCTVRYAS